jgi:hypothetical protein
MFAQHNISEEGLFNAYKVGGLAVPSLAVTKTDFPLTNFGVITLLAPKKLIDPKGRSGAKVFGADIYSPRYPEVTYKYEKRFLDNANEKIAESIKATGDSELTANDLDTDPIRKIKDKTAVKHAFLQGVGENASVVKQELSKDDEFMLNHPAIKPFVGGTTDIYDLTNKKRCSEKFYFRWDCEA